MGLQMARALGAAGARVMLTSRQSDELEQAVADLQSVGIDARWVAADGSQAVGIRHVVDETLHRMGDIDILLNNAVATWGDPAADSALPAWDAWDSSNTVLNLNVRGYLMLSQLIVEKSMLARRWGRIINVASLAALGGNADALRTMARNTAQNAMVNCTRALAADWGRYNITVNAICAEVAPALRTPDTRGNDPLATPLLSQHEQHENSDGVKGACVLFASDAGQHITGQCLAVSDGGRAMAAGVNTPQER